MPTRNIMDRLKAGENLLMDGATGSELQRRGVNVLTGSSSQHLGPWSATANVDSPEVVSQVHSDYLRVGAEIIISNNFWTTPSKLAEAGLEDRWEEYTRAAGSIAVEARDAMNPEAYVAGGVAPPASEGFKSEFADQTRVLADVGVDLMLPEYVGSVAACVESVDGCADAGLPVFLGVRHVTAEGAMQYGESFEDLAKALTGHRVDAVLLMCSSPEDMSASLPRLRQAFDGPIGVYTEIGYYPLRPLRAKGESDHYGVEDSFDALVTGAYPPSRVAEFAGQWLEMGAQIIGGCCATGPEHIAAMRPLVKGE